jgi:predicted RNase H-like HicB family nuclease
MKSMTIDFTVQIWKEGDQFIAHAMPIDVMSAGETPEAARTALDEALHLFFQTAADMGTLAEILEECGYRCDRGICVGPEWTAIEKHTTTIGLA